MSVAFDDHGLIVPLRGVTKKSASSHCPSAFSSTAARCSSSGEKAASAIWMA